MIDYEGTPNPTGMSCPAHAGFCFLEADENQLKPATYELNLSLWRLVDLLNGNDISYIP